MHSLFYWLIQIFYVNETFLSQQYTLNHKRISSSLAVHRGTKMLGQHLYHIHTTIVMLQYDSLPARPPSQWLICVELCLVTAGISLPYGNCMPSHHLRRIDNPP